MADVNHVISLGIGSPADIPHFVLFGLSINDQVPDAEAFAVITVPQRARTVVVPANARIVR